MSFLLMLLLLLVRVIYLAPIAVIIIFLVRGFKKNPKKHILLRSAAIVLTAVLLFFAFVPLLLPTKIKTDNISVAAEKIINEYKADSGSVTYTYQNALYDGEILIEPATKDFCAEEGLMTLNGNEGAFEYSVSPLSAGRIWYYLGWPDEGAHGYILLSDGEYNLKITYCYYDGVLSQRSAHTAKLWQRVVSPYTYPEFFYRDRIDLEKVYESINKDSKYLRQ